ncbi:MAG: hypothetical protein HY935_04845, partial [Nitrosomonadales bacterium]|nr:hypothetical protein [Nitrosomonadales bacterium]
MDRREAVLRELNLYPLWVRRNLPALEEPRSVRPELVEGHEAQMSVDSGQASTSSARTGINNIRSGSSVAEPVFQVDKLNWAELKQQVR